MFQRAFCISWPCSEMAQFSTSCSKTLALAHAAWWCQQEIIGNQSINHRCTNLKLPLQSSFQHVSTIMIVETCNLQVCHSSQIPEHPRSNGWMGSTCLDPSVFSMVFTMPLEAPTTCSSRSSFNTVMERLALRHLTARSTQDAFPRPHSKSDFESDFDSAP